jgi:hypothetical protein
MDREAKLSELEQVRGRVQAAEAKRAHAPPAGDWLPHSYYTTLSSVFHI